MRWNQQRYDVIGFALLMVLTFAVGYLILIEDAIFVAMKEGKPADWLGFAGNVAVGVCTIGAAVLAWLAVSRQVTAEKGERAIQRLNNYAIALDRVAEAWGRAMSYNAIESARGAVDFTTAAGTDVMMSATQDPVMGRFGPILFEMRERMTAQIVRHTSKFSPGNDDDPIPLNDLYLKIAREISARRSALQGGLPLEELFDR